MSDGKLLEHFWIYHMIKVRGKGLPFCPCCGPRETSHQGFLAGYKFGWRCREWKMHVREKGGFWVWYHDMINGRQADGVS